MRIEVTMLGFRPGAKRVAAQIDGIDDDFLFGNARRVGHARFAPGRKSSIVTSILIRFA